MFEYPPAIRKAFEAAQYRFYSTAAVQICSWTKNALTEGRPCYKQKFYGIPTHRCMEFSPAALFCTNSCIYCWRAAEFMKMPEAIEWPSPEEMVEALVKERRKLLTGFLGNPKVDRAKVLEAMEPVHFAISLSGEPMLYPKMPELIKYLRKRPGTFSIFIVTNGQLPEALERLEAEDALPTQLYVSLTAPTEDLYRKISVPSFKDAWQRLLRTLKFLSRVKTRTVLRITLIKGFNMVLPEKWAELIQLANAHFVEFKAFMLLGHSRHRLKPENMPRHEEVKAFAFEVMEKLRGYEYMDEDLPSRIVVFRNKLRPVERFIKGPLPEDNGF